ncbi:putative porin [Lutimonas sp.]|uniref:putative porin n=1 Tax=Lutimonas sp. TaxID=1872403 RepID=UPI003D9AE128
MLRKVSLLFLLFASTLCFAQISDGQLNTLDNRYVDEYGDTAKIYTDEVEIELSDKTYNTDYKVIDFKLDTTFVDTTLSMKKYYNFNLERKDHFEKMSFHNPGQSYNSLAYTFDVNSTYPKIGARAQHANYYEVEDIKYYSVPTPTTELMWSTVLEQGHLLDALFTFNLSRQFNASLSFKSIRSLGKYRHSLSDHGAARITMSYHTKNKKYFIRGHLVAQDLNNEQNGGLTDESVGYFESNDPNFKDRARLETNFTDAQNSVRGNRYYFDHFFVLWDKKDSLKSIPSDLKIGHQFNFERKHYEYEQDNANRMFGPAFSNDISDDAKYSKLYNEAYISLNSPITLGEVRFKVNNYLYNYSYKSIVITEDGVIDSKLEGNSFALGGEWHTKFKKFNLDVDASQVISGDLTGHAYSAMASFKTDSVFTASGRVFSNSRTPNFNFLLNQSDYKNYNWQNDFNNEEINGIDIVFDSDKWIYAAAHLTNIDNYAYFDIDEDTGHTAPKQSSEAVNYFKIMLSKEIRFGNFALDNQFIYQQVTSGEDVLRVPDFITRNTLYYANYIFKGKPLYLETGVTFSYFSKYLMNAYNPLISEFYLQNEREYGGFPLLDFFINFKVKTMRVYFKLEHFNSSFTEKNYYSAPTYPYRDFVIRFGLVWNFFI